MPRKTFPSSRNPSPILIQLSLSYSPLSSRSDGSNHRSLQGKSPSSARFKSFIFISLPCLLLLLLLLLAAMTYNQVHYFRINHLAG